MAILESKDFTYAGISSVDMGIINCQIQSNFYDEPFFSALNIIENTTKWKNKPYYNLLKRQPLSFKLNLAFSPDATKDTIAKVARWLYSDFYQPLIFSEFPDRIYYAMVVNETHWIHNGMTGYITCEFRCDDYCAYSYVFTTSVYDLTTNPVNGTPISLTNNGDLPIFPVLYIQIISGSTFSIVNNSNGAQTMSFTGLTVNENLTISGQDQQIDTDQTLVYRYSNMSGDFTSLVRGINNLQIFGNIKIQFAMEFKILQS